MVHAYSGGPDQHQYEHAIITIPEFRCVHFIHERHLVPDLLGKRYFWTVSDGTPFVLFTQTYNKETGGKQKKS